MANLILLSLDTLRADRLGCYGYPQATSPYLDHIAHQGVRFQRAYATDIPTEVAHTGLFSGRYGHASGIVAHGHPYLTLPEAISWWPEQLRKAGWTTAAVDNLYQMKPWFARGFRYYTNMVTSRRWIDGSDVTREAIDWLKGHRDHPFFLFVHYWDTHSPYLPPDRYIERFYPAHRDPFDPARRDMDRAYNHLAYPFFKRHHYDLMGEVTDPEYFNARYDAEVRYLDDQLQALDAALQDLDIIDDTWLILLADHGESFTEHNIFWDHCGLYENTVHIPLIMRWPARINPGTTVSDLVQQIDLAPTILEGLGLFIPDFMDGYSLWQILDGQGAWPRDRAYLSECAWEAARGIVHQDFKLITTLDSGVYERVPRELYHLSADPQEEHNLIDEFPEIAKRLESELQTWVQHWGETDPMQSIIAQGLPFVRRMDQILREVGLTWSEWKQNPYRSRYDQALTTFKTQREP